MQHIVLVLGMLICLAACGGGGGGGGTSGSGAGIDPRLARLDIYEAQKLRVLGDPGAGVMGMPITNDENVPTDGDLTFDGSASLRVETAMQPLVVFGDAQFRINFDDGTALGEVENAFGTDSNGNVVNYAGQIDLDSDEPGQNMAISYAGTLAASGQILTLAGEMDGVFLGDQATAIAAFDLEAEVDRNGSIEDATLVMTLEATSGASP